jgi:DNA polymerase III alpha subunit
LNPLRPGIPDIDLDIADDRRDDLIMYVRQKYGMPAHVEVYEPEMFKMNAFEMNDFTNFVVSRLHTYDALAKRIMGEREILVSKLEYIRKGGDPKEVFRTEQPSQKEIPKEEPKKEKKKKK